MDTLAQRLRYLLDTQGVSQNALAKMIGVTQASVGKIIRGETLEPKKIYEIATALNVNVEWLKTGNGNSTIGMTVVQAEPDDEHTHRIDILDAQAAANHDGFVNTDYPEIIQSIWFSDVGVNQILGRKSAKGVSIIKVPTDSMMPTISPRDLVFIDTTVNYFTTDGVYIFKLNGHTFIKRLQMLPNGTLLASSDNTNYRPFEITADQFDTAEIIGKFISVVAINPKDL
ncbi:repressor [Pasteurellaceae bacterium Pebbles2]|nr:repressor [Pasteurellaceae bacterium Pebbles2]